MAHINGSSDGQCEHDTLPCKTTLSAADYFRLEGLPLRKYGDAYHAPCPWVGGRTCPTQGIVAVHPQTGTFQCRLCAPDGGDTRTYHQMARRLTYHQAVDSLLSVEG
jgi:hypothetical protein